MLLIQNQCANILSSLLELRLNCDFVAYICSPNLKVCFFPLFFPCTLFPIGGQQNCLWKHVPHVPLFLYLRNFVYDQVILTDFPAFLSMHFRPIHLWSFASSERVIHVCLFVIFIHKTHALKTFFYILWSSIYFSSILYRSCFVTSSHAVNNRHQWIKLAWRWFIHILRSSSISFWSF